MTNTQHDPKDAHRPTAGPTEAPPDAADALNHDGHQDGFERSNNTPAAHQSATPVPRGPRVRSLVLVAVLVLIALWAGVAFHESIREGGNALKSRIVASFSAAQPASDSAQQANQLYQGPMHPWIVQSKPGTCPICGMDLVPISPDKFTGQLTINPQVVQNMGVRVAEVTRGPLTRTVRTVGTVDYNETQVRDVNIKVKGWIEGLHVDTTGEQVAQGDPLFDLYSPQLYAAQQELLLSKDAGLSAATPAGPNMESADDSLLGAARTRLLYYDITPTQIENLLQRGTPSKTMTIKSPHQGTVVKKHATDGMRVTPGMRIYQIADLSTVWVMATIYEYQLPYVREGQQVTMTLPYLSGATFEGEVDYIYPYMAPNTRQVKVRLVFNNPEGQLKPGMFASITLTDTINDKAVLAPREAILDTGQRQVALVSTGDGTFEPRDVKLGPTTGDEQVQILKGLEPGEKVVTSGQFLIDSEARMRASLANMVKGNQPATTQPTGPATQPKRPALPTEAGHALSAAVETYLTLTDQLASDKFEPGQAPTRFRDAMVRFQSSLSEAAPERATQTAPHVTTIKDAAANWPDPGDVKSARQVIASISPALRDLLTTTGVPSHMKQRLVSFHCPMYQKGTHWIQPKGQPRNPYMGSKMLACHDEESPLPVIRGGDSATQPSNATGKSHNHKSDHQE